MFYQSPPYSLEKGCPAEPEACRFSARLAVQSDPPFSAPPTYSANPLILALGLYRSVATPGFYMVPKLRFTQQVLSCLHGPIFVLSIKKSMFLLLPVKLWNAQIVQPFRGSLPTRASAGPEDEEPGGRNSIPHLYA